MADRSDVEKALFRALGRLCRVEGIARKYVRLLERREGDAIHSGHGDLPLLMDDYAALMDEAKAAISRALDDP